MAKKNMTEEQRLEKERINANKRAKRAQRWEAFKDGCAEVGGAMAPIVVPLGIMLGLRCAAAAKSEKKQNEALDLLAKGKGFTGRKDPKFVAAMYDDNMKAKDSSSNTEE